MDKREKELLFEVFALYVAGTAPKVSTFRSKQFASDLDKIDRLVTMQYMENKDGYYRIKPLRALTLDHPLVESETKIINCLLPRLIEMFMSNYEAPKFTRQQIKTGQTNCEHLSDTDIARALIYLKEAWVLEVVSSDDNGMPFSFTLHEAIRKTTSVENLIPEYMRPYDLGKAELARHKASQKELMASLIGPAVIDEVDFSWIKDTRLKNNAVSDWNETKNSLQSGSWKGAIIFAGSTMEGLLLAAITQCKSAAQMEIINVYLSGESKAGKRLTSFDLHFRQLIQLANSLGIISSGPIKFSHSVNDYRNLIHPGALLRDLSLKVGKHEAEAASSAVRMLDRDIREFRTKRPRRSQKVAPKRTLKRKPLVVILSESEDAPGA